MELLVEERRVLIIRLGGGRLRAVGNLLELIGGICRVQWFYSFSRYLGVFGRGERGRRRGGGAGCLDRVKNTQEAIVV